MLHSTAHYRCVPFLCLPHSHFRITMRNWCALTHCFYSIDMVFSSSSLALRVMLIFLFYRFCCLLFHFTTLSLSFGPKANMSLTIVQRNTPYSFGIECDEDNDSPAFEFLLFFHVNFRFLLCLILLHLRIKDIVCCRCGCKICKTFAQINCT